MAAHKHGGGHPNGGGLLGHHREPGMIGPPSAQVTYPYYTTRGPRDFLTDYPMPIGP